MITSSSLTASARRPGGLKHAAGVTTRANGTGSASEMRARFARGGSGGGSGASISEALELAAVGRVPVVGGASRRLLDGMPDPGSDLPSAFDFGRGSVRGREPVTDRFLRARRGPAGASAASLVSGQGEGDDSDGP